MGEGMGWGARVSPCPNVLAGGGKDGMVWDDMGEGMGWGTRVSPCPKVLAGEGKDGKVWVKVLAGKQG